MSNAEEKQKIFHQMESSLFQIHSMADILEDIGMDNDQNTSNGISNPAVSMAQIIKEKAELCLKEISRLT